MEYPIVLLIFGREKDKYADYEYLTDAQRQRFFKFIAIIPELADWTKLNDVGARLKISKYCMKKLAFYLNWARTITIQTKKRTKKIQGPFLLIKREPNHPTNPILKAPFLIKRDPELKLTKEALISPKWNECTSY